MQVLLQRETDEDLYHQPCLAEVMGETGDEERRGEGRRVGEVTCFDCTLFFRQKGSRLVIHARVDER